jgi:hypothetical protein
MINKRQLAIGTKIEMEHHLGKSMAKKIASDHIHEFPTYYKELIKMERKLKKSPLKPKTRRKIK